MMLEYQNLNDAYYDCLRTIYKNGNEIDSVKDNLSIGCNFGTKNRPTKELMNYSFVISNPTHRYINSIARNFNLKFAIANVLWCFMGNDELEFINYYNDKGAKFSDDGKSLHGAHGKRLMNSENGSLNFIKEAIKKLQIDKNSRRAVALCFYPEDIVAESKDIPCIISMQFLVRNNELNCIVNMRSQSAIFMMPYDVFLFTFLQEYVAHKLQIKVGKYYHNCASFHYYLDEELLLEKILKEQDNKDDYSQYFGQMQLDIDMDSELSKLYNIASCEIEHGNTLIYEKQELSEYSQRWAAVLFGTDQRIIQNKMGIKNV